MDLGFLKTYRRLFILSILLGGFFASLVFSATPTLAATGTNQTVNFQGRLLNAAGAAVPDGFYNLQFKIYQDGDGQSVADATGAPSGSLKWTESYLNVNSQGVKVINGYLSVQLGSVTAFGGSIDWNQNSLWLSMNIGSTNVSCASFGVCTPDGEMTPMQPLTSAVYALNSNALNGLTSAAFGQLAATQTFAGASTFQPTGNVTGVKVLQSSAGAPTADIFNVQSANATNLIQVTGPSANNAAITLTSLGAGNAITLNSAGALNFTGAAASTWDIGNNTLSVQTTNNGAITTGTGLLSVGGNLTFNGTTARTITGPTTGGLTITDATGPVTISTTGASGTRTLALNSAGGLSLTGAAASTWDIGNNTLSIQTTTNGNITTGTGLVTLGGSQSFSGTNPTISTSTANTNLTVQTNGTGTLTLNSTGAGTVNLGTTNSTTVGVGNTTAATQTTISGGTNATAIQITQGTAGGIIIGGTGNASTVSVQCGLGTSTNCSFANNSTDHTTTVGSTTGTSLTTIQAGSGGVSLSGNVTTTGTINTNTLSSTALTFSGASPVIGASTTNTGLSLQTNGTGTLTLNSTGAGTVNLGTTNSTTVGVGNTTAATQTTISGGTNATAVNILAGSGGTLNFGTGGVANTLQIGSITGGVIQTIGIGNNATASSIDNITIGNLLSTSNTLIQGGTNATAIQLTQGTGGGVIIGGSGNASTVNVQCGAGTSTNCGFANNVTDHTTVIGSSNGVSLTTLQAGTGGITLTGAVTTSSTINGSTLSSTALTFGGAGTIAGTGTNTGITVRANGTGTLTLNTVGAGIVNLGGGSTTTVGIGNTNAATTIAENVGTSYTLNGLGTSTYNIGAATTTGSITIGSTIQTGASATILQAGATSLNVTTAGAIVNTSINSTTAFQIQNAVGTNLFTADTTNGRVGIGTATPNSALEVSGDITLTKEAARIISVGTSTTSNTVGGALTVKPGDGNGSGNGGAITIQGGTGGGTAGAAGGAVSIIGGAQSVAGGSGGGVSISTQPTAINGTSGSIGIATGTCNSALCSSGSVNIGTGNAVGIGNINLQTGLLSGGTGNFYGNINLAAGGGRINSGTATNLAKLSVVNTINGSAANYASDIVILGRGGSGQTGDLFQLQTNTPATVFSVGATGSVLSKNSTNSTTAFQIQNTAGTGVFVADTTNQRVGIGISGTASQLLSVGGTTGNFTVDTSGNIVGGTVNTNTLTSTALTFFGASPVIGASTTNTGLTAQANGTGTLTLNTTGAGTINLGTTNSTTIGVGNTTAATTTTISGGTGTSAVTINTGTGGTLSLANNAISQTVNIGTGLGSNITIGATTGGSFPITTIQSPYVDSIQAPIIAIGTTNNTSLTLGNTGASDAVTIQAGTSATAIQLTQSTGGGIIIGGTGAGSTVTLQCGAGTTTCNLGSNATDHTTLVGGTTTVSATTIQAGTGGLSLGNSGVANTIQVGNTTGAVAQTINLGNNATGGSQTNLTIGSLIGASATTIQAGSGGLSLAANTTVAAGKTLTVTSGLTSLTSATGANDALNVSNSTGTGNIAVFKKNATTVATIADNGLTTFKPSTNSASAFQVQPSASLTPVFDVDTTNSRIGINTATPQATLDINSTVSGNSGLRFAQLTSASTGGSSYTGILGLDTSGNVGLSQSSVSLTSPALAYWDGQNNPTSGSQSYPLATVASRGTTTFTPTFGGAGNGEQLTQATGNETGTIDWSFSQVPFEEIQFQMKAGSGAADGTWFYSYADGVPTTEYGGTGGGFSQGYIIYFGEFHNCVGIAYGAFTDGNQCGSGGGANPLTSVSKTGINDNAWHDVDIQIIQNKIVVRWDNQVLISYSDVYTRDLSKLDFGFGARTGGSNNTHFIKNLLVTKLGTNANNYNINSVTPIAVNNNTSDTLLSADSSATAAGGGKVIIGNPVTDTHQTLLQLDSFSTYADTATCATTTNQGALYYSTSTSAIRSCINGAWEDVVTTAGLGVIAYGVIPDTGTSPGDLSGVNTADLAKGPCWVYMGSANNTIRWTGCTVYTQGRKQLITAQTTDFSTGISTTAGNFQNLCIFTAGSAPSLGTAGASATTATLPTWSAGAPAVCLASIVEKTGGSGISTIYDTRIYTTDTKEFATLPAAAAPGFAVKLNGTAGQIAATAATTDPFYGVVGMYSGTVQTTAVNAIIVTGGPVYVRASAGSPGAYIKPTATAGIVSTSALVTTAQSDIPYNYLGIAMSGYNAPGTTQCSITANADTCRGSILVDIAIR